MASFIPTDTGTLEDQRLYTQARQTEVACLDCLAQVGVKKNSEHHTSIQWTEAALRACPVLVGRTARSDARSVHDGCPRMGASIDDAARGGRIPIGAEDGY